MYAIVAVDEKWGIGRDNGLLFRLPADLKRFRSLTEGHTVLMGRKTLESLPGGRGLPNRRNIVLSRTQKEFPGCECYESLDEALRHCTLEECRQHGIDDDDIYIIGGASVYSQAMDIADRLCLTEIDDTPEKADVFFPPYNEGWKEEMREVHDIDERHAHRYAFVDYLRSK